MIDKTLRMSMAALAAFVALVLFEIIEDFAPRFDFIAPETIHSVHQVVSTIVIVMLAVMASNVLTMVALSDRGFGRWLVPRLVPIASLLIRILVWMVALAQFAACRIHATSVIETRSQPSLWLVCRQCQ